MGIEEQLRTWCTFILSLVYCIDITTDSFDLFCSTLAKYAIKRSGWDGADISVEISITDDNNTILHCKTKMQYLFTCKVSKYCLLTLHGSINPYTWLLTVQNSCVSDIAHTGPCVWTTLVRDPCGQGRYCPQSHVGRADIADIAMWMGTISLTAPCGYWRNRFQNHMSRDDIVPIGVALWHRIIWDGDRVWPISQ